VIDVQECPAADLAIAQLAIAVLKMLVSERWSSLESQQRIEIDPLERVLLETIRDAERASVNDVEYLRLLGVTAGSPMLIGEVWRHLGAEALRIGLIDAPELAKAIDSHGPLARRIRKRHFERTDASVLRATYDRIADCLGLGERFAG
jgi:hypothetical protein